MTSTGITPAYEKRAEKFYRNILSILVTGDKPFMIAGTYAVKHYTGIDRPTKDIDIFCKAGDYPVILNSLKDAGYDVAIEDERWLARAYKGKHFVDIIFGSIPGIWPITDGWLKMAPEGEILGHRVHFVPPEELIVSKAYRMKRNEFDGADVTHIILRCPYLDWKLLLDLMEPNWEILFVHILLFRFTYPSERNMVPGWIMEEMVSRIRSQLELPAPKDKVSRGALLAPDQYRDAIRKWGFKDLTDFTFSGP